MTGAVEALILDLLEWLTRRDRSYEETMEAWRTSCPKLQVWEDANERGLVSIEYAGGGSSVRVTAAGAALLKQSRGEIVAHAPLAEGRAAGRFDASGQPVTTATSSWPPGNRP